MLGYSMHGKHGVTLHPASLFKPGLVFRLRYFTDFVLCLGGDGVILHASSLFQTAHPPVCPHRRHA